MSEEKTISELTQIDGAFDEGNVYECVWVYHRGFKVGAYYGCDGRGIIDNDGDVWANGGESIFKLVTAKEKGKTISKLSNIDGAFDEENVYECVESIVKFFTVGVAYKCDGKGIIDNDGYVFSLHCESVTFKLVKQKEEAKAMRTPFNFNCRSALTYEVDKTMRIPFNLERAIAGDKVVDSDGSEYNQFSVIKTLDSTLINCYSVGGNCAKTYSEKAVNTLLFMVPKMGKGFINVDAGGGVGCYRTKLNADRFAGNERIMCIDLSQFPEGYGL